VRDEIIVEYRGSHVYAAMYGKNNYDLSLELWQRIMALCKEHNCFKILGENFTTQELSTMDAFDHLKIMDLVGITLDYRIAWVSNTPETAFNLDFVETVVVKNRGLANGRVFPTIAEAKSWLLGEDNK
jgi:hypothetical protein